MRFTQNSAAGVNLIRAYGDDQLKINDEIHRGAVIVCAERLIGLPDIHSLDALIAVEPAQVLALSPELLLLGTGKVQVFPPAAFSALFLKQGIGVEVMDTGAACRTYNVLVAEQRRAVAMLLV